MGLLLGLYGLLRLLPTGSAALFSPQPYEVGDGQTVSGLVVRSEGLLLSSEANILPTLQEGQWVGAGQQVAVSYIGRLTAGSAGYFSSYCDGYEAILTPQSLDRLSLQTFSLLQAESLPQEAYGRLVLGQDWYFVCTVAEGRQKSCAIGKKLELRLNGASYPVKITRMGNAEGGEFLLILRCDRRIGEVLCLRQCEGSLIFGRQEGLLLPKDALCMEDGKTGVYVLQSGRKRFKEVKILCFQDEKALVEEDRSTTRGLRREDRIILS